MPVISCGGMRYQEKWQDVSPEEISTQSQDNLVLNNSGSGIILFNYAEPLIYHNTIVGNGFGDSFDSGGSGISIGSMGHEKVQNNIVVSNNGGINTLEDSNPDNHHNLVWGNVVNYVGDAAMGEGDLLFDPRFVDPASKDYRLRADSPAIDAGVATPVTVDYAGNPRLFGAAPDIGAWESLLGSPAVSVYEGGGSLPKVFALRQNYPNPFNPNTTIEFGLPQARYITLTVYNLVGEEVATLIAGDRAAGTYKVTWEASGSPSGVFFYRLTAGDHSQTKKAVLVK